MNQLLEYYRSSIGKKQIVAVTGLALIIFVIAHLAGNLFIFWGPVAYNAYAKKLASLRPGLYVAEILLTILFLIHIYTTYLLVLENQRARGEVGYRMKRSQGNRSWSARLMAYSGTVVLAFVIWHLLDFTFADHHGPRSVLADGQSYGLYGVVYNSFSDPLHAVLYIIAMMAVGLHLNHGVESFLQTFGFNNIYYIPLVKKLSHVFSFLITAAYSAIPIYVLLKNH